MPGPKKKRSHAEVVDLAGDDAPASQSKRPALATSPASRLNAAAYRHTYSNLNSSRDGMGGTSVYNAPLPTPPSSSFTAAAGGCQPAPQSIISSQAGFDESELLDLTQDDDGPARELYGSLHGKIVGIRYYKGVANPGELVLCCREPDNQYDRNAIRMDNVQGQQIGHIPRKLAEKLAPYIDRGQIVLDAFLTGMVAGWDCPVRLDFYGPSDFFARNHLEKLLKEDKLLKANDMKKTRIAAEARKKSGLGLTSAVSTQGLGGGDAGEETKPEVLLQYLQDTSQAANFRKGGDAIQGVTLSEEFLSKMPMTEQPKHLQSKLLPYQLQGLAWMTAKENVAFPPSGSNEMVQLWKRENSGRYWNAATEFVTATAPGLASGGILADDMGLGKTLQIISLILTGGPGTTLIVAPVSVMSNWEQQMKRHVLPEHVPNILMYHSGYTADSKRVTATDLMKYDVVITSYGKLARELDGDDKVLTDAAAKWRRVVLDEGHNIRNAKTKIARAACEVNAKSRWVLSGTPIINTVKDLQSLVKFLRMTGGIELPDVFNTTITRAIASGQKRGELLLQNLMQDICLRRRKDMEFVDLKLPEKKEYIHRIAFRPEEKRKYDALLSEARGALEEYQAKSAIKGQSGRFQGVLERLLRLRQTCNHWTLCKKRIDDLLALLEEQDVVVLNEKNRALLQEALRLYIQSQEDCAVCYDVPTDAVITHCKHVFCRPCITRAINLQHKCPMCRNRLSEEDLLEPAPEGIDDNNFDSDTQSSKTEALLQILQATLKNKDSKVIVFSQWTSFLNIIQNQLSASNIAFTRLDGSMNTTQRDTAIRSLDSDPSVRVMLASLAACSVGLNLVAADTVILSDSWWAPAIEDQAVDRVHRLGQTRETSVWRLVMEGSVEERVLDIQGEKRQLVGKAFQEDDGEKRKKVKVTRVADMKKLLS